MVSGPGRGATQGRSHLRHPAFAGTSESAPSAVTAGLQVPACTSNLSAGQRRRCGADVTIRPPHAGSDNGHPGVGLSTPVALVRLHEVDSLGPVQTGGPSGAGAGRTAGGGDFKAVGVQRYGVRGSGKLLVVGGGRGRLIIESVCERWVVRAVAT